LKEVFDLFSIHDDSAGHGSFAVLYTYRFDATQEKTLQVLKWTLATHLSRFVLRVSPSVTETLSTAN
jgi:hypothetical protein